MKITFLGTSHGVPAADRYCSCTMLEVNGAHYFIDAGAPLDGYRLIFTPMVMTLEDHDLGARMAQWVRNGGTWVVGPLTDVRNADGARYRDRFYGMLEELTGVRWLYGVPDTENRVQAEWADGEAFHGEKWFEISEDCGEDALVRVTAGHAAILGKSLVMRRRVGRGEVVLLGSVPSEADMRRLHRFMEDELEKLGVHVDAWYFCPHHPDYTGPCDCRKPAPGMLLVAMRDFDAET